MRTPLVAAICLTLAGCVHSHYVAIGPPQPPKPPGCALRFVETPPEELVASHTRVGSVCIADERVGEGQPALTYDSARAELSDEACALGGELVTRAGTCTVGKINGTEFAVMRAR